MNRISTTSTTMFVIKKGFPLVWCSFMAYLIVINGDIKEAPTFAIAQSFFVVFAFLLYKKFTWKLMDEVYDYGDFLLIRNHGKEDKILISNIMNVSSSSSNNPPKITLHLVTPSVFGTDVYFVPTTPFSFMPITKNQVVEDLIVRVDKARSNRVL